eukprot:TRINITY_DN45269_c0_g1_i1.p1 TRINITY_DN45269_c0_g1~~TRINITY_DN45269_c0_g1_i1.p1  ORF type:complete len:424 (-),score=71.75 TRINITY_DN45269_c0_g1_i1:2-1273(-)
MLPKHENLEPARFRSLVGKARPFGLRGWRTEGWATWSSLEAVRSLADAVGDRRIDVACAAEQTAFAGDARGHQSVSLRFIDFLDLSVACEQGKSHWAQGHELEFYLCQCPVLSNEPEVPAALPELAQHVDLPRCIDRSRVSRVNLWISTADSCTTTHYDANDNLLMVTSGSKRVKLWAPDMCRAGAVWATSPNHGAVELSPAQYTAQLDAGDALFIPEGWWHQVESTASTVALNVWFCGLGHQLTQPSSRFKDASLPYYIRALVLRGLTRSRKRMYRRMVRHARKDFRALHIKGARVTGASSANTLLRAMSVQAMLKALPDLATRAPKRWKRILREMDELTVEIVTTKWEEAEQLVGDDVMQPFYQKLFAQDHRGTRRNHMLDLREDFTRKMSIQLMNDVLCSGSPGVAEGGHTSRTLAHTSI